MNYKKYALLAAGATIIISGFLINNVASAASPFDRIDAAIQELRTALNALIARVDALVLNPGPVGPAGPIGPTGPQGPVGPQGPAGSSAPLVTYFRQTFLPVTSSSPLFLDLIAYCDTGDKIIAGGFTIPYSGAIVTQNGPTFGNPNGWIVSITRIVGSSAAPDSSMSSKAICQDLTP